jgi:DNA-binding NarL/FixJ family response regulator
MGGETVQRVVPIEQERRVLIVDDHRSFAEALAIAIDAEPGLRCAAIASTAAEGLATAVRTRPDLVVIDLQLPDAPGLSLVAKLHRASPDLPILALTAYADAANVAAAARAGVCAFFRKECTVRSILDGLHTAGDGPLRIDADTLSAMTLAVTPPASPGSRGPSSAERGDIDGIHLTPREREVLELLAQACDASSIARRFGISLHTIRGHVKAILAKLDAHTQLEAVVRATQLGLIGEPPRSFGPPLVLAGEVGQLVS